MAALSITVFMLLLFSGSIFLFQFYKLRIESTLPICCTLIVFISFIFGLFGLLNLVIYVLLIIGFVLYLLVVYSVIKNQEIKYLLKKLFTPGLVIYYILCCVFIITTKGKLFSTWDEFSHWGDIVKVMSTLDDFGTNSSSMSIFPSYPPGMALFQYVLEKINYLISDCQFVEWLTYYAYYVLVMSYFLPFTKHISFNKPLKGIVYIAVLLCIPFAFYNGIYYQIYIDPFLSFLFAAGLLHLLFDEEYNAVNALNMYSIMFMLVLAKDSGLVFAITLLIAYIIKVNIVNKEDNKNNVLHSIFGIVSIVLPKLLWLSHLKIHNIVSNYDDKIDFNNLWKVIIGKDTSYRPKVVSNFMLALEKEGVTLNIFNVNVNYIILFITVVICFTIIIIKSHNKTNSLITCICAVITCLIFVMGMCVIYMYKFSEYEALRLAAFNRYINTIYMSMFLFICISFNILLNTKINKGVFLIGLIMIIILCCPFDNMSKWISRQIIDDASGFRSQYDEIVSETNKYAFENAKIYFISQESDGLDSIVYKLSVRPYKSGGNYSIGEPFYENDIWTKEKTAKEWQKELVENYDYVALYNLNTYFYTHYYYLFEDPDHIYNNHIYAVDKTWGVLVACE